MEELSREGASAVSLPSELSDSGFDRELVSLRENRALEQKNCLLLKRRRIVHRERDLNGVGE
jgi:hypothetical protein